MEAARSRRGFEEARHALANVEPEFDRRRDLSNPLAVQMMSLAAVAEKARKEFCKQWPRAKGGRGADPLAIELPNNWLALSCWDMVAAFFGPDGVAKVVTTPGGKFDCFVKEVAGYALDRELRKTEFEDAIKYAKRKGDVMVQHSKDRGEDFFLAYRLDKERFG